MTILADPATICATECEHPECLRALADLWAGATAPLTPPF